MLLAQFENALALGLNVTTVSDLFRPLFFFIDGLIYSLIPNVYSLIYKLYDFNLLFGEGVLRTVLTNMSTTVYSFLAIFMFFRVAFSLITMLVDPSVIDDKERGAKKIVTNIMICLVLIVAVPYGFKYAKVIQTRVIEEKLIERVVTGDSNVDSNYDLGNEMALSVWSVFLRPAEDSGDAVSAYNEVFNSKSTEWNLSGLLDKITDVSGGVVTGIVNRYSGTHYSIAYVYLLSTIAGIYILWMFITVMIDVAYRAIKFFALEIISPIAIVSYIDPASSKKGLFSKWLNETVKTYLSLFIRLFVFAFATVLLRTFALSDIAGSDNLFVYLIYILAIIAFIKNGPKFIDNLFGTSMSKDGDAKLGKSILGGLAGGAVGALGGGITGAVVAKRVGKNADSGALAGAWNTGKKAYSTGKKGGLGAIPGVIGNTYGSYGEAKKKYGYDVDTEQEKLIKSLMKLVPAVNAAKGAAVDDLIADDYAKYNEKLAQGAKVNGRKYGKGLEGDDGLENLLKKNAGGLAQDELLHEGDEEYLALRRAVAKAKDDDAILTRVNSRARSQYSQDSAAYNAASDKTAYVMSFEADTARMQYEGMEDGELVENFRTSLESLGINYVNMERQKFDLATSDQKIDLVVNSSGLDRTQVSAMSTADLASEYQRIITENAQKQINDRVSSFTNAASKESRINIAVDATRDSVGYEISSFSEAKLTERFDAANEERIRVKYGHSLSNIEADAGKASGDAKKAQEALDQYLKSGKGKKAKNIDSAFSLADARAKANALEEKRKQEQNKGGN